MKFGLSEVIHPLSTEKVMAEYKMYMFGDVKERVEKVSDSIHIIDDSQPLSECIKAIKHLQGKDRMYAAVEFFTDAKGICRMNVCYMQQTK